MAPNKKGARSKAPPKTTMNDDAIVPAVAGQRGQVLDLIRRHPVSSLHLTADHAIPGAYARLAELRAIGFDIRMKIERELVFRGRIRRNIAVYSIGNPEWSPPPGWATKPEPKPREAKPRAKGGKFATRNMIWRAA